MKHFHFWALFLLLSGTVCWGQTVVNDYVFTTGVDSSLWVDMTVSTPWQICGEVPIPLPFTFSIWNRDYNEVVVYPDGSMLFRCQMHSLPLSYFPDSTRRIEPVTSGLFGYRNATNMLLMQSTCLNLDSAGRQVWVMEMRNENVGGTTRKWQIRVAEEDNSLTLVYGSNTSGGAYPADIGLMLDTSHVLVVDPSTHTVSSSASEGGWRRIVWPGHYRYYRFEPAPTLCATPTGLHIGHIGSDGTSVRMLWYKCSFYSSYRVEYGAPGFAEGEGTTVTVFDTSVLIENLTAEENVEVRVYGNCSDSSSGYTSMVVHLEKVVPTYIHGYEFTTGVNSELWYDMGNAPQLNYGFSNLPFPVFLSDRTFYRQNLISSGALCYYTYASTPSWQQYNMSIYGYYNTPGRQLLARSKCFNSDSPGHRVFVIQECYSRGCIANYWQVQMREDDHSVTIVYGEPLFHFSGSSTVSLSFGPNRAIVNQVNHTVSSSSGEVSSAAWPGQFRYYRFVPLDTFCPNPVLQVRGVSLTSDRARLVWESCPMHNQFLVEYGPAGFAEGTGIQVTTTDTTLLLQDLLPEVDYEARVTALCPYGTTGYSSLLFRTPCRTPRDNKLWSANIYADSVKCCTGSYNYPSNANSMPNMVDYGPYSADSRHSSHTDQSYCLYYNSACILPVIPDGFCSSVRLGRISSLSSHVGAQQESITYTLVVDTNQYELLIIHYAMEQEVQLNYSLKPCFFIDITDSLGHPLPGCYQGDLITGDWTSWVKYFSSPNHGYFHGIYNWDAVGVDLSPLHGQTIHVTLSRYDGFWYDVYSSNVLQGSAYFTLETASKRIHALSCGNGVENTFRAPKGFNYRWYAADNPSATLSRADTLHVTTPGEYKCRLSTRLGEQACGFDIGAYAGSRYPAAAFDMQPLDSCGSLRRFVNQSAVSRDEDHTQMTSLPCDDYLWVFGDGATSIDVDPVHRFGEGTHTVTLYAMLANGDCIDSVSHTFTVTFSHDTLFDSICQGQAYLFFGRSITEAGQYTHVDGCRHITLHLKVNPVFSTFVADTFAVGDYYLFDGVRYWLPGVFTRHYTSVGGCDSAVTLSLCCIAALDTTICSSSLPFVWHGVTFSGSGTDTVRLPSARGADSLLVLTLHVVYQPALSLTLDTFCQSPGGYSLSLPYNLCYLWTSNPVDTSLPDGWVRGYQMDSPVTLSPSDTTLYSLTVQFCDSTPCPWRGTMLLAPVAGVDARIGVSPPQLTEDELELTAVDLCQRPHDRMWFVNGEAMLSADSFIVCRATPSDDSVRVMLVVSTPDCTDTAYATVPVRIQSLWFPNVFAPGEAANGLFRGYGVNVRDYELSVYTRWGDCIFRSHDINQGWDGTYRGVRSPASAYLYVCRYTTLGGEHRTVAGTVTLVR